MEWPGTAIAQQGLAPPDAHDGWPGEELLLQPSIPGAPKAAPAPVAAPKKMVDVRMPDKLLGTTSQVNDAGQQLFKNDNGALTAADPEKHILKWNPDKKQYDVFSAKTEQQPAPSGIDTLGASGEDTAGSLWNMSPGKAALTAGERLLRLTRPFVHPLWMAKSAFESATEAPSLAKDILTGRADPGGDAESKLVGDLQMAAQPGSLVGPPGAVGSGPTRFRTPSSQRVTVPLNPANVAPGAAVAGPALTKPEALFTDMADVGLTTPRSFATENRGYRAAASAAAEIPGSASGTMAQHAADLRQGLGDTAQTVAEQFGAGSRQQAGQQARDSIVDWVQNRSKAVMGRAYDDAEAAMGPPITDAASPITSELTSTADAAQSILNRRANARIPGSSGAVNFIQDAASTPGGLNYQGIKHLRTAIGEMTPDEMVAQGMNDQEKQAIYGGLTEDLQRHILDNGGPDALHSFMKANDVAQQVFSRRSELAKIVGIKGDVGPEQVFDKILTLASEKGGANLGRLQTARKAIGPDAWNEVASASIMRLGRDAEGNFSPDRFVTEYGKLNPSARSTLFKSTWQSTAQLDRPQQIAAARQAGNAQPAPFFDPKAPVPDLAESLNKIERISSAYHARITDLQNKSRTAPTLIGLGALTEIGKSAVSGDMRPALKVVAGMVGGRMLADWLSKPLTAAEVAKFVEAKQAYDLKPSPVTKLIYKHAQGRIGQLLAMGLGSL